MDKYKAEYLSQFVLLSIDEIKPYHAYPFYLFKGKQFDDLITSMREQPILDPVIVRKTETGYELLVGHNRRNAAKLVGFTHIPAIIKENLTEEEAYTYVIESNMMQRNFAELLPSEKAAVIHWRYHKIYRSVCYKKIAEELKVLLKKGEEKYEYLITGRYDIASTYGYSDRHAIRYLRINYLIEPLKDMLDEKKMSLLAAVELSYLSVEQQEQVVDMIRREGKKLKIKKAQELRKRFE